MTTSEQSSFRILIVEDDPGLNQQMSEMIANAGYQVDSCFDGEKALLKVASKEYQLILLDIMLPNRDGLSVLKILRKTSLVPVIIISAKGAEEERITGLTQGADDYVSKPFNPTELLLRIEAIIRRSHQFQPVKQNVIEVDDLALDLAKQQASIAGQQIELTSTQFKIIWELAFHRGEVLSKALLSQQALNRTLGAYDRGLDMHLSRIRRKLTDAGWRGDRVQTVHGEGYCLK